MENIINEYLEELINSGKAQKTIDSYITDVKQFLNYLTGMGFDFQGDIPRFAFNTYKEELITNRAKPATINKKVNSLHSFNSFLIEQDYMKKEVIHPQKDRIRMASGSQRHVTALSEEEVRTLLFYLESDSSVSQRNKLIIYLMLYTGVRVSELVNIHIQNIDPISRYLEIEMGKGNVQREIPLRAEVLDLIEEYRTGERSTSPFASSPFLLLSQRAGKMHRDAVNRLLQRIGNEIGVHLHPHLFRHTFASNLVKKGVPITTVSKLAGHSNINTTVSYYIATTREEKLSAVELL